MIFIILYKIIIEHITKKAERLGRDTPFVTNRKKICSNMA